jgi:hypothetical protein
MWRHRFFQLCAIKNYQLIANPHVWAAQSWHLRGIAQAVDESGALCSIRTGVRPRLEHELATTPTTGATRMCIGVVFTSNQQSDGIYLPEDDRRKRRMVRLPNGDFTPDYRNSGDGTLAVASTTSRPTSRRWISQRSIPRHRRQRRRHSGMFYTTDHRKKTPRFHRPPQIQRRQPQR